MSKKKKPTRKLVSKRVAKTPRTTRATLAKRNGGLGQDTPKTRKSRTKKTKTPVVEVQEPFQNDSVVNFWKDFEEKLDYPMNNYKKEFPTNYSNVDFHGHLKPLCPVATKKKNDGFFKSVNKKVSEFIDDAIMYSFDHPLIASIALVSVAAILLFVFMILLNKFH
jgi:hypothetical protein